MAELEIPKLPALADTPVPESVEDKDPEVDYVKKQFNLLLYRLRHVQGSVAARLRGRFALTLMSEPWTVETPHGPLSFVALGKGPAGRARSLFTKQPSTIAWIDSFRPNSVFWDIGANVGVYTLYAARRGDTSVVAFEPAAVNYFVLSANCEVNAFDDRVTCLLMGLGQGTSIAKLEVSQFEPGHSFSFKGKRGLQVSGRQSALVLSMDRLVNEFGLACPNYIKIDVPALTGAIIEGGARTLQRPQVRELHIEASEESTGGRRLVERLTQAGFTIAARHVHGETTDLTFVRSE